MPLPGAPGFVVRRALDDDAARGRWWLVAQHAPHWVPEVERALEHGSCLVAVLDDGRVAGVGCHSVNRAGWVGPLLTDPAHRQVGIGRALLVEISRDLSSADLRSAEIAWIGPLGFYVRGGRRLGVAGLPHVAAARPPTAPVGTVWGTWSGSGGESAG